MSNMIKPGGRPLYCLHDGAIAKVLKDDSTAYEAGLQVNNDGVIDIPGIQSHDLSKKASDNELRGDCGTIAVAVSKEPYEFSVEHAQLSFDVVSTLWGEKVQKLATDPHGNGSVRLLDDGFSAPGYFQLILTNNSNHGSYAGESGSLILCLMKCILTDIKCTQRMDDWATFSFSGKAIPTIFSGFESSSVAAENHPTKLSTVTIDAKNHIDVAKPFTSLQPRFTA